MNTSIITHPDPSNTNQKYWERILRGHGLAMSAGLYIRDKGKRGAKILLTKEIFPREIADEDGEVHVQTEDDVLSALYHGSRLEKYFARTYADERLRALIAKFLSLSARQAAARYGLNPGTVFRLQREFFEERADRPEVIAAKKALGCTDEPEIIDLPVLRAALYLAMGEAA